MEMGVYACEIKFRNILVAVDYFMYLGLQVAADGGFIHRMNERYRTWGALKLC